MIAYGQSKMANVLFAVGATRHWTADGIWTNAVHPGAVDTNLARHLDPAVLEQIKASGQYQFKTAQQGGATSVLVATSPQLEDVGGLYFQDCNEAPVVDATPRARGAASQRTPLTPRTPSASGHFRWPLFFEDRAAHKPIKPQRPLRERGRCAPQS
jgi:NAD(P)-dependent dehydrogenase (short-subunit alcohol dehydrogenase family)